MINWIYRQGDLLFYFRLGRTKNDKIFAGRGPIMQTYTFSRDQYEYVAGGGTDYRELFGLAGANCLDCGFSENNGYVLGRCYTHKFHQGRGFLGSLTVIAKRFPDWDSLPTLPDTAPDSLVDACQGRYVRFGTYGEPSLIPASYVEAIAAVANSWTGYTHQWDKEWADPYKRWFMASVHSIFEDAIARDMGWRTFIAMKEEHDNTIIHCPASKESGYKSSCNVCSLCSGTEGKGGITKSGDLGKSVAINVH